MGQQEESGTTIPGGHSQKHVSVSLFVVAAGGQGGEGDV